MTDHDSGRSSPPPEPNPNQPHDPIYSIPTENQEPEPTALTEQAEAADIPKMEQLPPETAETAKETGPAEAVPTKTEPAETGPAEDWEPAQTSLTEQADTAEIPTLEPFLAEPAETDETAGPAKTEPGNPEPAKKPAKKLGPSHCQKAGPAEKIFNMPELFAVLLLVALAGLLAGLLTGLLGGLSILQPHAIWIPLETRFADAYSRLTPSNWLIPIANGLPYTDTAPLYLWFLTLLDKIPGLDAPRLFAAGACFSTILFTAATWLLARSCGLGKRTALAAGLLTLSAFIPALIALNRLGLLFAAAIVNLALIFFYRAWRKASSISSFGWLCLAFPLTAFAFLAAGFPGLVLPLIASVIFLVWQGSPERLNKRDGALGCAVMLLLLCAWLIGLLLNNGVDYLRELFASKPGERLFFASASPAWWFCLAALPIICLPWLLGLLFVNWGKALRGLPTAWKTRREYGGRGWLWIILLSGLALFTLMPGKTPGGLLLLLPAAGSLLAASVLGLSPGRSRWFFGLIGLLTALLGLTLAALQFHTLFERFIPASWISLTPEWLWIYLKSTSGIWLTGLILFALGLGLLIFGKRSFPGGSLLVYSVGIILAVQTFTLKTVPSLDNLLAPTALAQIAANRMIAGEPAMEYLLPTGQMTYDLNLTLSRQTGLSSYAGKNVMSLHNPAQLETALLENPRLVLFLPDSTWPQIERPGLTSLDVRWLGLQKVRLVRWNSQELSMPQTASPSLEFTPEPVIEQINEPVHNPATMLAPEFPTDPTQEAEAAQSATLLPAGPNHENSTEQNSFTLDEPQNHAWPADHPSSMAQPWSNHGFLPNEHNELPENERQPVEPHTVIPVPHLESLTNRDL